jgi:hypothetical protein
MEFFISIFASFPQNAFKANCHSANRYVFINKKCKKKEQFDSEHEQNVKLT